MKLIEVVCEGCEGSAEILIAGEMITPADLDGEAWWCMDEDGQVRCKECGSIGRIEPWKRNRSRFFHRDRPDFSGSVQTKNEDH